MPRNLNENCTFMNLASGLCLKYTERTSFLFVQKSKGAVSEQAIVATAPPYNPTAQQGGKRTHTKHTYGDSVQ
jgi:hypothetical protein